MPIASMADAMVLAVYMPPQAPAPGQAWLTIFWRVVLINLAGNKFTVALKGRHDIQRHGYDNGPA